jgi:hypothetical protein
MSKVYYKEEQKFRQLWIWLLLLLLCGVWIWQFVQQIIMGKPFGNDPSPDFVIILTGIFPIAVIVLFRYMTLETIINDAGIYYRFRPFQRQPKEIKADDILSYEVKKYNALMDYGGWGIRLGSMGKGKAYNVSGNQGVLFELKNRKKFMLGTQNPVSIKSALDKLMKKESYS